MEALIDDRAMIDDEEEDESFDEETGDVKTKSNGANGRLDDSSEEDDDDDDEEAAAEVARGFIVDEDEDDGQARRERRRERKKRRREEREDEDLDEEDLELIGMKPAEEPTESKFKRLKRGPREDRDAQQHYGVNDIFGHSDEEEEQQPADYNRRRQDRRGLQDEFDDFIEEDVFSDEDQQRQREDEEVARPNRRGIAELGIADAAGLDEQALEDFRAAFGDGTDYDFALEKEDEADAEEAKRDKNLHLKDVFEPSQLAEKLLTDEDNNIRFTDIPERYQLARRPYQDLELTEDEFKEEAPWIANFLLPGKKLISVHHEAFRRAVAENLDMLVRQDLEPPFIFQHRKDYLFLYTTKVVGVNDDGSPKVVEETEKLLTQVDLWDMLDYDLKYRALIERKRLLQKTYTDLKDNKVPEDATFEHLLHGASSMEDLQDLQEYLYFEYASQLKDLALTSNGDTNGVNMSQKKASTRSIYEEIRASRAFGLVRAFGISADAFARNATREGVRTYTEDPTDSPENLADNLIDEEFPTGTRVLKAAKGMFIQQLAVNPRLRQFLRQKIFPEGAIDCQRTEKGLRKIDEQHPYYEFKYLRNQDCISFTTRPELFLKMLKAEDEGLIEIRVRLPNLESFKKQLNKNIETDNYSTVADAWNQERREAVSAAVDRIMKLVARSVKENLKDHCEKLIGLECREDFYAKLDQAPWKPLGHKKGTIPRVLALTNGGGAVGRDPVYWAYVNEDGRVPEHGQFKDLGPGDEERGLPDGKDVDALVEVIRRRDPEVIAVSGWFPETRKLLTNLATLVKNHDLRGATYIDDNDEDRSDLLEVLLVNDEVARMSKSSERMRNEYSGLARSEMGLYCVGLARYLQSPLQEYASLGQDIVSINFHPAQNLLPPEKLFKKLEQTLVDMVMLTGVDLNNAVADPALSNLLPYVAGLGPRKASHLIKVMNLNSGFVRTRAELLGVDGGHQAMGLKVWSNAASFLCIPFEPSDPDSEPLDGTRIHPEDYDIARKMAADALELDEEDIEAERQEGGAGAIVRRLIRDDATDRVNDLVLEEYAVQLEQNLHSKKRATLKNITDELNEAYEEIRTQFRTHLGESEVFTMLTGETRESLQRGMNVPISLKRVSDHHIEGRLECGLDAVVEDGQWADSGMTPKQLYTVHQTVQAHITSINRKDFVVTVSLRDDQTKKTFKRFNPNDRNYDEWDDREEAADKKVLEEKSETGTRVSRVVKHPLFRPFNSKQAEEYLGSQNRGDVLIRPSSKGSDHLAVTWKVADGIFQHVDVLELDKENEFSLGRTLRIGGRYNYSDLDELIVLHVKAMARKVDEMCNHEKFQNKSKAALEEWLNTYTNANPKRSMYQFCLNRDRPGQFHLVFKAGQNAKLMDWSVRVIPQGFELMRQPYPTMRDLCNGFKLMFQNMQDKEQGALFDRVIRQVALLRVATVSWTQIREKTKRYLARIVDEDLYTLFPTSNTQAFSDILLGNDFPTLESLLKLPDAFTLDPAVRREHFVVYLAVWQQDGQVRFTLYTGSGAALTTGSDGRIRNYAQVTEMLDEYYTALLEAFEDDDQDPDDLDFPNSDRSSRILDRMSRKVVDHIYQGFRLVHLGVAFLVKRTGPHGLTQEVLHPWLRCWIFVLEALVNFTIWTLWLGDRSMDPDDQKMRFLFPWNVQQRPYIGLNLSNPLFEFVEEADPNRVTSAKRKLQRLTEIRKLLRDGEISESDERAQELREWKAGEQRRYFLSTETARRENNKSRIAEAKRRLSENNPTATNSDPEIRFLRSEQARNKRGNDKKRARPEDVDSDVPTYNDLQKLRYGDKNQMAASAEARLKANDLTATEDDPEVKVLRSVISQKEKRKSALQTKNAKLMTMRTSALKRLRRGDPTATESDEEVMALRKHEAKQAQQRQYWHVKNNQDAVVAEDEDEGHDEYEDIALDTPPVRPSNKRKLGRDVAVLKGNGNGIAASGRRGSDAECDLEDTAF